jgi:hypothetical protein
MAQKPTNVAKALDAFNEREARYVERNITEALRCLLNATGAELQALASDAVIDGKITLLNGQRLFRAEFGWVVDSRAVGGDDDADHA